MTQKRLTQDNQRQLGDINLSDRDHLLATIVNNEKLDLWMGGDRQLPETNQERGEALPV